MSVIVTIDITQSRGLRLLTTIFPKRVIKGSSSLVICLVQKGSRYIIAGKKVIESTNAQATPMATKFPRCWKGGASEKFILKKPRQVVKLAAFVFPCCRPCRNVTIMCTELAMAIVKIIVGADAEGGEIG